MTHWRETILTQAATVAEAIANLNASGLQIAMVVDEEGQLLGTITDGDIRRALLRGITLTAPVDEVLHADPLVVPAELDADGVAQMMRANRLRQLPIVDAARKLVGLHLYDEMSEQPQARPNTMVVMAGGRGVRLRPHTENCPKPMLTVGDKPMLEHIIERARAEGFSDFLLAIHYLGHMIEDHFGDGGRWGVRIRYLREDQPLGTGGALSLIEDLPSWPLLVTNGDVLSEIRYGDLLDFHRRHGASATMAVRSHELQHPFGVVHTDGVDIAGFEEKPIVRHNVNAGIYAIDPQALAMLNRDEYCDMPSLFERLSAAGQRTIAYPMHEPWLDVGRPADLAQARSAASDPSHPHIL